MNRQFHAGKPNEKWLTDVTEFKYYVGLDVHKVYLSAILDLYDRRIVSFVIRDSMTCLLSLTHWMQQSKRIPTHILCFIATEDSNTHIVVSTRSWRALA